MWQDIRIPFAFRIDTGEMVSIDEVARGLACNCKVTVHRQGLDVHNSTGMG